MSSLTRRLAASSLAKHLEVYPETFSHSEREDLPADVEFVRETFEQIKNFIAVLEAKGDSSAEAFRALISEEFIHLCVPALCLRHYLARFRNSLKIKKKKARTRQVLESIGHLVVGENSDFSDLVPSFFDFLVQFLSN